MRSQLAMLMGAAFGLALVATCEKKPGANYRGDADLASVTGLTDLDGASDLLEMQVGDAMAGTSVVHQLACDKQRQIMISGSTITQYYAELSGTGVGPADAPHVAAVTCQTNPVTCSIGATCSGYVLPANYCVAAVPIIVQDKVIISCSNPSDVIYIRVN